MPNKAALQKVERVDDSLAVPINSGVVTAMARAEAEIKAQIVMARQAPRSEAQCAALINEAMDIPAMAAKAVYSYPRGSTTISGPSVYLARELARHWCNLRFGVHIIGDDEHSVHVRGYCFDLEKNTMQDMEAKFNKLVQRKNKATGKTEWRKPDERDLRELTNKHGAICMRNAILQVMPSWLIDEAVAAASKTMARTASGDLAGDRKGSIRSMVSAFMGHGVTVHMIEKRIGHSIDEIDANELTEMRQIYSSIKDGNSKREAHFEVRQKTTSEIAEKLTGVDKDDTGTHTEEDPPSEADLNFIDKVV